jgi:hypothetical protein
MEKAMDQSAGNLAWMSPALRKGLDRYEAQGLPVRGEGVWVATRFKTDPLLKRVYSQLKQKNRKTKGYRWRNQHADPSMDPGEALDDVLARVIHMACCAVRDDRKTNKGAEAGAKKAEMRNEAAVLRKVADDLVARNPTDPKAYDSASAGYLMSFWWEAGADCLAGPDDPLTIKRDHGDNLQQGVQIHVAETFKYYLGHRMDRLAAIIAGIALGKPALDASVSRSALTRPKSTA